MEKKPTSQEPPVPEKPKSRVIAGQSFCVGDRVRVFTPELGEIEGEIEFFSRIQGQELYRLYFSTVTLADGHQINLNVIGDAELVSAIDAFACHYNYSVNRRHPNHYRWENVEFKDGRFSTESENLTDPNGNWKNPPASVILPPKPAPPTGQLLLEL